MKIQKVKTFTVEGQKHSKIKVTYTKVFQTMRMVGEDGTIFTTKRFFRLNKMPRWLGKIFIRFYRKPADRFKQKVLELDAKLGQK